MYPIKNLPDDNIGIYSPDCGCINVPHMLRTLHKLGADRGVVYVEYAK